MRYISTGGCQSSPPQWEPTILLVDLRNTASTPPYRGRRPASGSIVCLLSSHLRTSTRSQSELSLSFQTAADLFFCDSSLRMTNSRTAAEPPGRISVAAISYIPLKLYAAYGRLSCLNKGSGALSAAWCARMERMWFRVCISYVPA